MPAAPLWPSFSRRAVEARRPQTPCTPMGFNSSSIIELEAFGKRWRWRWPWPSAAGQGVAIIRSIEQEGRESRASPFVLKNGIISRNSHWQRLRPESKTRRETSRVPGTMPQWHSGTLIDGKPLALHSCTQLARDPRRLRGGGGSSWPARSRAPLRIRAAAVVPRRSVLVPSPPRERQTPKLLVSGKAGRPALPLALSLFSFS